MLYTLNNIKREEPRTMDKAVPEGLGTSDSLMRQNIQRMPVPDYLKDVSAAVNFGIPEEEPSALQNWADRMEQRDIGFTDTALEGGIRQAVSRVGDLAKSLARSPVIIDEALGGEPGGYSRFLDRTFDPLVEGILGTREQIDRQYKGVTFEQVKQEWSDKDVGTGEFAMTVAGFIAKEGLGSIPDMVALFYAPYAYLWTRSSEIATERKELTGENTSMADLGISVATAAAVQYLDKLGLRAAGVDIDNKALSKAIADASAKATAMRVGRGVSTEMATEFTQEYMEYVGTTVQDNFSDLIQRSKDPAALEAGLAGAIAAAGFGTAVATATEIDGRLRVKRAGPSDDEQAAAASSGPAQITGPEQRLALPPPEPQSGPAIPMPPPGGPTPPDPADPSVGPPGEVGAVNFDGSAIAPPTPTEEDLGYGEGPDAEPLPDQGTASDLLSQNKALLAKYTQGGTRLRKTALGQFLRATQAAEPSAIPDPQSTRPTIAPGKTVERLFDNLTKLLAAQSQAFEERYNAGGTRMDREKYRKLTEHLERQSQFLADVQPMVRDFVRDEVNSPSVDVLAGLIDQHRPIMKQLGLPADELRAATEGNDPGKVQEAIEAINRAANRRIQQLKAKGFSTAVPERKIDDVAPGSEWITDPKARKARAFMQDAEMEGRDTTRGGAATMTAEAMGTGKVPYTEEVTRDDGRTAFRMKEAAYGSEEAKERRRLIREEERARDRQKYGFYTDYTREGPQYGDEVEGMLDDPDAVGEYEYKYTDKDGKKQTKKTTVKPPVAAKAQPVRRLDPSDAKLLDDVRERIQELQVMLQDPPERQVKRGALTAAERARMKLKVDIEKYPLGSKRRILMQKRLEDLNARIATQPIQKSVQTLTEGSKPLPGGQTLRYYDGRGQTPTQADRLRRADRAERNALRGKADLSVKERLRLKALEAKLTKLSPEARAQVEDELNVLLSYLDQDLWSSRTQTPQQVAGQRLRAPGDSKKILRENINKLRKTKQREEALGVEFDLNEIELGRAATDVRKAKEMEELLLAKQKKEEDDDKAEAEAKGEEYDPEAKKAPKPSKLQPTGRFEGQDLYSLQEKTREQIRKLEAKRRSTTPGERGAIDEQLAKLKQKLAQVGQEIAALRWSDSPPAAIDRSESGVSQLRRERARRILNQYGRDQKESGKGLPLAVLKQFANLARQERVSERGLNTVYVFSPEIAAENPRDLSRAIIPVRGAYPKRVVEVDERKHIVKMYRPQPYKLVERKDQLKFQKLTGFLGPRNVEFYLKDDVIVWQDARPATQSVKLPDGNVTEARSSLSEMERIIHPEAFDRVLKLVSELNLPWDGPADEFAVTEYLLSLQGPQGVRRQSPPAVADRWRRMIEKTQVPPDGPLNVPVPDDPDGPDGPDGPIDDNPWIFQPPTPSENRKDQRAELVARIAERREYIENIKAERGNLMDKVRATPIEDGFLAVEPHDAWIIPKWMFSVVIKHKDGVITDKYEIDSRPVEPGQSVDEAMFSYVDLEIDALLKGQELMLAEDLKKLEEMDEPGNSGTPGPRPPSPPSPTPGPATPAQPTPGGGGTGPGGNDDPRKSGVEFAPERRQATDLFLGLGPSDSSYSTFVDRAAPYRVPGPDGRPGLTEEQTLGVAKLVSAWINGAPGFLNMDGTGFGKSRQILAAAHMISTFEEENKTYRPILVLVPGKKNEANRLISDVRKTEAPAINVNIDEKYENGTPRFVYRNHGYLQEADKTEYAAIIADEAHYTSGDRADAVWGPALRAMNTNFRAFFTATPTDRGGQEIYYLQFLAKEENETPARAEQRLLAKLGVGANDKGSWRLKDQSEEGVKTYIEKLNQLMLGAVKRGLAVSRTFGRLSKNFVTTVPDEMVHQKARELHDRLLAEGSLVTDAHMEHLVEYMKLPYMIDQAEKQIREEGRKVIAVFKASNPSKHPDVLAAGLGKPAAEVLRDALNKRGIMSGYFVGESAKPAEVEYFQGTSGSPTDGPFDLLITTDSKGGTGYSFNDKWGIKPRYMMVANTFTTGEKLMQVLGRHDRSNNKTIPYTEIVKVNNDTDRYWRQQIAMKIAIQDLVTGYRDGRKNDPLLQQPQIYEMPEFLLRKRTKQKLASEIDRDVMFHIQSGMPADVLVDSLAKTLENPALRALAERLSQFDMGDLNVELVNTQDRTFYGRYIPHTQTIQIQHEMGAAQTLLHELIHHFTFRTLINRPEMSRELQALMEMVKAADPTIAQRYVNAFRTDFEFVAEIFTDPDFIEEMDRTYVGPRGKSLSMLDRFVRWLGRLLGVTSPSQQSVLKQVMAMPLFERPGAVDFESMPLHRLMPPNLNQPAIAPLAKKLNDLLSNLNPRARAGTSGDRSFRTMLQTMTYGQIVDSFGSLFDRQLSAGKPGNILEDLELMHDQIDAEAYQAKEKYQEVVLDPMRKFAAEEGSKMIKVRLAKGAPVEEITRLEFLAHVMNMSGYANLHFTKPATDPRNRALRTDAQARAAWRVYHKQFSRPEMAEARKLYSQLADFFDKQQGERRRVLGGVFLDNIFPDDPTPWGEKTLKEINAKLKELGGMSDDDLKKIGGSRDSLNQIENILQPGRVQGAYFPLRRYGDYVVVADGDQAYYSDAERDNLLMRYPFAVDDKKGGRVKYKLMARFDTNWDAEQYAQSLAASVADNQHIEVKPVMIRATPLRVIQEHATNFTPLMANFTRNLQKRGLKPNEQRALQTMFAQTLLDMMPETSAAQSLRPREGTFGATLDTQRMLNDYGSSQGFLLANLKYARKRADLTVEFNGHVRDLEKRHPAGKRMEIIRQVITGRETASASQMQDLGRFGQTLTDVGFLYYLVGASYNIVNATQVPLLTAPYLAARYGVKNTTKALTTAYGVAGRHPTLSLLRTGGSLTQLKGLFAPPSKRKDFDRKAYAIVDPMIQEMADPNHRKLMEDLKKFGDIESTMTIDMARMAERAHVDEQGRPIPTGVWDYLTDWMRVAPHTIEVMNRSVTAIAAFDLEYARSKDYEKARRVARQAIKQTHFVFKFWNKPPIFQHPAGRVALMYKQHVQGMYYYMIRNAAIAVNSKSDPAEKAVARKALLYMIAMHVMAAGVVGGTPELAKWLLGLGYLALGDDEPWDYDRMVRNAMYDLFGDAGATFASQGLLGYLGMDISGRVGINSMLTYDGINTTNRETFALSVLETAGGPMAGLVFRGVDAWGKFQAGMYGRMAEDLLPKAIRDPVRAYRLSTEGFQDLSGKVYLDAEAYSWWDFTQQVIGFTPKTASDIAGARSLGVTQRKMEAKRERFFTRYYTAKGPERAEVWREIQEWNRENPAFRITMSSLTRSVAQRRKDERRTVDGIVVPKQQRQWAAEQQRSY